MPYSKSTPGFFPPQTARAYGYTGIANYEAVVNGIDPTKSLQGQITGLALGSMPTPVPGKLYNWAICSNTSTAEIMRKMFAQKISDANLSAIDSLESTQLTVLSSNVQSDVVSGSVAFGKSIAAAVY